MRNFRVLLQAALDGSRDGLAGLSAQAGLLMYKDGDAAQGTDHIGAGADRQPDAQLLLHALFHSVQIAEAAQIFQPVQEPLFILAGQAQHAQVASRVLQQGLSPAVAGAGRAFGANREGWRRSGHGLPVPDV
jgi:hypothetical protein